MGKSKWITPSVKQWWCASSILICMVGQGMMLGFTASLLPALQAAGSSIQLDIGKASWLTSILGPAFIIGVTMSSLFMSWLGRRASYLLAVVPGVVGWAMISAAETYLILLIGRILTAVTTGATTTSGMVMIGECVCPEKRAMFLNLKTTAVFVGSTLSHFLGSIHWRSIAIVALVPHVISFAMTLTWPESPSWLASRKQYDKCEIEFFWLRGVTEKSVREVTELIESQKERFLQPKKGITVKIKEFFKKFTMKDFLMPLFINIVAFFLMETSGRHYFPAYALQIMKESLHSKTSMHYYTLCIDIIATASSVASAVLIRMTKVRTLLFATGIATLVVKVFICILLFLTSSGTIHTYPWIITGLFVVYFAFANLGCSPIPISIQGELFPLYHREVGTAVAGAVNSFCIMVILKAVPYMMIALNVYGTMAVFGVAMAISLMILFVLLPETKNKTLQEIENYFKHGEYRTNDICCDDVYKKMIVKHENTLPSL